MTKLVDCVYYLNSACLMGSKCQYRHCFAAKVTKMVCPLWHQGLCRNPSCGFRPLFDKENIPCFHENRPGGCKRNKCGFLQRKKKFRSMLAVNPHSLCVRKKLEILVREKKAKHASEACTTERRKCANCKGKHAAYSKIGTKWQQEKEIQQIKVLENLSYSEAKKQVVNILPPRTSSSYANAVMTNTKSKKDSATQTDIGTQTEISNIERPTNIDNLTSESHKDPPIAQKPITNNLIEQETTLSPPETSFTDLESLNLDKRSPETLHLSVPSDTEVLMEIDKSSTKGPATDNVQDAAKILKPLI
ncbi:uncharacterized protein TNCT_361221 [Trichonephila clavata]|uniref:C3H1-type domain-containing protein n=1 Tax=Trichonephila clavata TaxID=2740835 RepID=A0A8X6EYY6_TRICU|nr:uncharacterized protein TNCT_361221 [Trichonephila clavata]